MTHVLIAGAGPAGLVAAIKLARSGRKVMVVAPRLNQHKIGECVPGAINHLLTQLELPQIDDSGGIHRRIGGTVSLWASSWRQEDSIARQVQTGWRLNRTAFEQSLENVAISLGIERLVGRVRIVHRSLDGRWQIETDNGCSIMADWIVDATGRNASIARKQMAKMCTGTKLIALWSIGKTVDSGSTSRTLIESHRDGWWYAAFLPDGRPIAIFHTSPELATDLKRNPTKWVNQLRTSLLIGKQVPFELFTGKELRASNATPGQLDPCFGDGWVACGDAALSFDPIASHGIFNALTTGSMVADALIQGDKYSLVRYQQRLTELGKIVEQRRSMYYDSASIFFRSPFWLNRS
jgi:flavin-dependent dehydrogenase